MKRPVQVSMVAVILQTVLITACSSTATVSPTAVSSSSIRPSVLSTSSSVSRAPVKTPVLPTTEPTVTSRAAALLPGLRGRVVYVAQHGGRDDIYLVNANGTDPTCLTCSYAELSDCEEAGQPQWSSSGQQIAFICYHKRPDLASLYLINADGSDLTLLTHTLSFAWFPDGKRMICTSATTGISEATDSPVSFFTHPGVDFNVSPDGTKLTFVSGVYGLGKDLWVMDSTTGQEIRFAEDLVDPRCPTWLEDAKEVVYIDWGAKGTDVHVIDVETREERLLTAAYGDRYSRLSVSPNRSQVAFTCSIGEGNGICVINADGTGRIALPATINLLSLRSLSWSPDGKWVIFSSSQQIEDGPANIYIASADGADIARLTDDGAWDADWGP